MMQGMRRLLASCVLVVSLLGWNARAQTAGEVQIYRCTAADGHVSLQDTPCANTQTQQVRTMTRPQDPPPRPPAPPSAPAVTPNAPQVVERTVYLAPPRAMYECTTPDGDRYTSDDDRGNPRWVPYWTLGYPTVRPRSALGTSIGDPEKRLHPPARDINWPVAAGGGRWIHDDCFMLPPREVCARLRDRRSALSTRFFNAQPSERDRLRLEQRSLDARLNNDCGGR